MKLILEKWNKFVNESEAEESQELDAAAIVRQATAIVKQAWDNTSESHLEEAFGQRAPGGAGSTFDDGTTLDTLETANWHPHPHKNVREDPKTPGYPKAFKTNIGGVLGMLPVGSLSDNQVVRFQPAHVGQAKVPKNAPEKEKHKIGKISYEAVATFKGGRPQESHATLLIGPQWYPGHAKDSNKPVIWTFYPGDPTPPPDKGAPQFIVEKDILTKTPNTKEVRSGFKSKEGEELQAYIGTIADAKKLQFGNIKFVEGL